MRLYESRPAAVFLAKALEGLGPGKEFRISKLTMLDIFASEGSARLWLQAIMPNCKLRVENKFTVTYAKRI